MLRTHPASQLLILNSEVPTILLHFRVAILVSCGLTAVFGVLSALAPNFAVRGNVQGSAACVFASVSLVVSFYARCFGCFHGRVCVPVVVPALS